MSEHRGWEARHNEGMKHGYARVSTDHRSVAGCLPEARP